MEIFGLQGSHKLSTKLGCNIIKQRTFSNRTDWKGLVEYINAYRLADKRERNYIINEAGDLFKEIETFKTLQNLYKMMHVNVGGTWKEVYNRHVNVSGVWKPLIAGYVKVGGAWKSIFPAGVPDGLIALSDTTISLPYWTEITATYHGKWIRISTGSPGSTGGSNAHSHTKAYIILDYSATTTAANSSGNNSIVHDRHDHDMPDEGEGADYHAHSAVNSYPARKEMRLYESSGALYWPESMYAFWSGTIGDVPEKWSYIAAEDYYPRITTGGSGSLVSADYSDHVHTGNTQSTNETELVDKNTTNKTFIGGDSHSHSFDFSHSHSITLKYFNIILVKATSPDASLPSGLVALSLESTPADGWEDISTLAHERFLRCKSTYSGTGGNTSHDHSHSGVTGYHTVGSTIQANKSGTDTVLDPDPHRHSIWGSSSHPSSNHIPEYVDMRLWKKL
jgi:hypothetical protein